MANHSANPFRDLKERNSELLRREVAAGALVHRALPEIVSLNHTDLCNLRCVMCPRNLAQGRHRLDRGTLSYLCAELLPTAKKLVLTVSGGEPLAADFDFLLDHALRFGTKIDVTTNGLLLAPALYARANPVLDHVNVSVDSVDPAIYAKVRLGGDLALLQRNLVAIGEWRRQRPDGVLLTLSAVVMRSTLHALPGVVRFAAAIGADAVILQRLRHEVKPTPEEELQGFLPEEEIRAALATTWATAVDLGQPLLRSDLGLPNFEPRPFRSKVPDELLGTGRCSLVAQRFSVMYTGEVYPCCEPTDYCLGNVRWDHPIDIWNGRPWRELRRAQQSRRGTLFCSGCQFAPFLPARPLPALQHALRHARLAVNHVWRKGERAVRGRFSPSLHAPPLPAVVRRDGGFVLDESPALLRPAALRADLAARDPSDGSIGFVRDGAIGRAPDPSRAAAASLVVAAGARAGALANAGPRCVLVSFEHGGGLLRADLGESPRAERVLELSDPRSSVRHNALVVLGDGVVVAGEYGTFPGARVAFLHASFDGGRRFERIASFPGRHIHAVTELPGGEVAVAVGDLAGEATLRIGDPRRRRFRTVLPAWAGFTSLATTRRWLHAGSDLGSGNGLLRLPLDALAATPEWRPLPPALDLPVRQLIAFDDGGVVALVGDDDVDSAPPAERTLLRSRDEGASWSVVATFAGEARPEGFAPLAPRGELLTLWAPSPQHVEVGVAAAAASRG